MLYKFKSKAAGDVIMLEPNGRQVLQIMGKDVTPSGIVLAAQMPQALQALEAAVAAQEAEQAAARAQALAEGAPVPVFDGVSLRQRVKPLADMLRRSANEGADVVWGV